MDNINSSRFPSHILFSLKDERNELGVGDIVGPNGALLNVANDSDCKLRVKFSALTIGSPVLGLLFELPFRIFDFATLGSIDKGIAQGNFQYYTQKAEFDLLLSLKEEDS